MLKQPVSSRRSSVFAAMAVTGALLSFAAAPAKAMPLNESVTYSCNSSDMCDSGEKPWCRDASSNEGYTHCSTIGEAT